jgi:2-polyprenyl-3-methyl-5-hydroxy-6-metoxy-1,4-benzoquinol methylase
MQYFSRDEQIVSCVSGRKVLHLGCVGFTDLDAADRLALAKQSLHYRLSEVADVTGIDYSKSVIDECFKHGMFDNVVYGDVQHLEEVKVEMTFDVIVVGDIIEHLSNPGLLLDGMKRFCGPDSKVILTTPNAFGLITYFRFCLGIFKDGLEHVMTFNEQQLRHLFERHGYEIEQVHGCYQSVASAKHRLLFPAGKVFFKLFPKLSGTHFVIARLK